MYGYFQELPQHSAAESPHAVDCSVAHRTDHVIAPVLRHNKVSVVEPALSPWMHEQIFAEHPRETPGSAALQFMHDDIVLAPALLSVD